MDKTYGRGRMIEGLEAIAQTIDKILMTHRYEHIIYSDDYGHELDTLVGESYDVIVSEAERLVKEALSIDDRINDVVDFSISPQDVDKVCISFVVQTVYGDVVKEVTIGD